MSDATEPDDLLDKLCATPAQRAWVERFTDQMMHPLQHIICPTCSIRFGMEASEMAFTEQTETEVWCPHGHKLRLVKQPADA